MSRIYTVNFAGTAVSANQDLFTVTASSTRLIRLIGLELANEGTADFGDAQEEGLRLSFIHGTSGTTVSSGGSAPTPSPTEPLQGASGFSARANDTTKVVVGSGTLTTKYVTSWNVRMSPGIWQWTPEQMLWAGVSERLMVEIAAPNDSITLSGTLWVEELG